jgi:hypothetical protein
MNKNKFNTAESINAENINVKEIRTILNRKAVKQFMNSNGKQVSPKAIEALEARVYAIMRTAIALTPGNHRVTDIEIYHAKG